MMARIINAANKRFYESVEARIMQGGELFAVIAVLDDAKRLKNLLSAFDMDSDTREFFNQHNRTVDSLYLQFSVREPVKQASFHTSQTTRKKETNLPDEIFSSASIESPSLFSKIAAAVIENSAVAVWSVIIFVNLGFLLLAYSFNSSPKINNSNQTTNASNVSKNQTASGSAVKNDYNSNARSNYFPSNAKTVRPKNGETLFAASKSKGCGSLLIENGTDTDAVAKLVDLNTGKTYRQVYIQSRSNYTINGIRSGNFTLMFTTGGNYSPDTKRFATNESFEKFDETLNFSVTRTASGVQWENYRATLNKTIYGSAPTSPINADDFADR